MAFIPLDAAWYIAEIVERIVVEGDPRAVVHVNLCLIRANGPDEALAKAQRLGKQGETSYANPGGVAVSTKFLGLRDLHVIHEPLEDGAELMFEEHVGLSDAEARDFVRPDADLAVFRPILASPGPDYAAGDVLREAESSVAQSRGS